MAIGKEGKDVGTSKAYRSGLVKLRGCKHLLAPDRVASDDDFNAAIDSICTELQKQKLTDEPETEEEPPRKKRKRKGREPNRMHTGGQDREGG